MAVFSAWPESPETEASDWMDGGICCLLRFRTCLCVSLIWDDCWCGMYSISCCYTRQHGFGDLSSKLPPKFPLSLDGSGGTRNLRGCRKHPNDRQNSFAVVGTGRTDENLLGLTSEVCVIEKHLLLVVFSCLRVVGSQLRP